MVRTTKSKKLTKKQKLKLERLRLKQDPAFFFKQRLKGIAPVLDRLGNLAESLKIDDWLALGIGAWAWKHTREPSAFLAGAVGYKLARTSGGTPPISQITGIGILSGIGIVGVAPSFVQALGVAASGGTLTYPSVSDVEQVNQLGAPPKELSEKEEADPDVVPFDPKTGCPDGYHPQLTLNGWVCRR